MNKSNEYLDSNGEMIISYHLDITPETCPMTFVRTKLMIEKMATGEIAEVRLKGAEPLENVPKSVNDMGHSILLLEAENVSQPDAGVFRLLIKKN